MGWGWGGEGVGWGGQQLGEIKNKNKNTSLKSASTVLHCSNAQCKNKTKQTNDDIPKSSKSVKYSNDAQKANEKLIIF